MTAQPIAIPAPDELEVSLFGPGFGECVVVHLGGGEWMVVDSCLDPSSREPAALSYLSKLGVDAAHAVKLVVVTHWHDDHIRGAARVVGVAPTTTFACSGALKTEHFFQLIADDEELALKTSESSGVAEFARVLRTLDQQGRRLSIEWATSARRLYTRAASGSVPECEVFALSPSSATVTLAMQALAAMVPRTPGTPKNALVSPEPNQLAVVLHVRVGRQCALLGADLETGTQVSRGWLAILNDGNRPPQPADVYKVAHHGSKNADHPDIWRRLLGSQPIACLTPFRNGRVALPSNGDIKRIKSHTPRLYSTSHLAPPRALRRNKTIERTIGETARVFMQRAGWMGHVQVRLRGSERKISMIDAASEL